MDLPEIPINKDVTYLGLTTYRDQNQLFWHQRKDRRQHVYILGKSGTGKSVLMFNMIIQNIQNGEEFAWWIRTASSSKECSRRFRNTG